MSEPTALHAAREKIAKLEEDIDNNWNPWKNGYYHLAKELFEMHKELAIYKDRCICLED